MKQDFTEFFDPYNKEHLRAYRCFQETGMWSVDFALEISYKCYMNQDWPALILAKLAQAWIDERRK